VAWPSTLDVTWSAEAGPPPRDALAAEARRLAALLGHPGELRLTTA
jgi:hypothetical protein